MVTSERFREIVSALKEQVVENASQRKAWKPKIRELDRVISSISSWNYWSDPRYKEASKNLPNTLSEEDITVFHILYNRIRKRPPHTGSFESDERHMNSYYGKMVKKLLEDHNVKVQPNGEFVELFEVSDE
jgi:hypothetical protein